MTYSPLTHIRNMGDLIHVANCLGSFFFSTGAMRCFQTRLSPATFRQVTPSGSVSTFVTSDIMYDDVRVYSVRYAVIYDNERGHHSTDVGTLIDERYPNRETAINAMDALIRDDRALIDALNEVAGHAFHRVATLDRSAEVC